MTDHTLALWENLSRAILIGIGLLAVLVIAFTSVLVIVLALTETTPKKR